jgi:hypothetical protein
MIPFLSRGDLDIGAGESGTALFNAVAQALDVQIVASLVSRPPEFAAVPLLVSADLFDSGEVTKRADLEGRKVAINVATVNEFTGVPPAMVVKAVSSYFDPNGEIHKASTDRNQNYPASRGYTELSEPLPLPQVVTDAFLLEAVVCLDRFEPGAPDSDDTQN